MGVTGSLRSASVEGISFNATGDANAALNDRFEKEAIPHSGGNMIKVTLSAANVEAVKLTLTPSEYVILKDISDSTEDLELSYVLADGSQVTSQGSVNLGPFQSDDNSCEVMFLTSTGVWDIFAAS